MAEKLESKSRADLEKLLQVGKIDVGNGTLFGAAQLRKPRKQGLTLVISSGGSGMSSIREAMRIADQKLEMNYKNYVKFIVVDSSTGEVSAMEKAGVKTLNISSPGAQARMMHNVRPSFFKKFMPEDYNINLLNSDGASQDRMTGKIKLYDENKGTTNDTLFRKMIQDLFKGEWAAYSDLNVDIMILSGLSGGNGSGTFIDLAAQAKAACPDQTKVRVYGYLMLPDTAERYANTDAAKRSLYRNGFAALKELESYMSIPFSQSRTEVIPSTQQANEVRVSATNCLFDYPVLISGNYDDAVSMIGETIVNLVADSGGVFDQRAFYSNIQQFRNIALSQKEMSDNGILKPGACPEDSHMYCGIGYAQASIPEKIVIPNIVSRVCNKLYVSGNVTGISSAGTNLAFCSKEKRMNRIEFEKQIRTLFGFDEKQPLNANSLWLEVEGQLRSAARLKGNQWDVSLKDIVNGDVQEYLEGFQVDKIYVEAAEKLLEVLKKLYDSFIDGAASVMKNYGPRSIEYLYKGIGNPDETGKPEDLSAISIKTLMETVTNAFVKMAGKPGKYPDLLPRAGARDYAKEVFPIIPIESKLDRWKQSATNAAQQDVWCKVAGGMVGASGGWKSEYLSKVENFVSCCERFADVLETVTDFYAGAGKSLDSADFQEFSMSTGERNGVNLCSDAGMYAWVKQRVGMKINEVDITEVKTALVDDFMEHSELWISEDPGKARKQYDSVMSRCCAIGKYATANNGLNLTITDYFEEIMKDVPTATQQQTVNNVVTDILQRLLQSSTPSLETRSGSFCHINKIILVPQTLIVGKYGPMVDKAFRSHLGDGDTFSVSSVVESIVCYQASVANPLSALKDLSLWEDAYESAKSATMHLNNGEYASKYTELTKTATDREHNVEKKGEQPLTPEDEMLAGTGLAWIHYPSPNVMRYEGDFASRENTEEARYRRDVFDRKIEYALKEGIIECEQNGNVYRYFINQIPEDWTNLSVRNYKQRKGGSFARGAALFQYLANQNPHSSANFREPVALVGSAFFDGTGFDFTEIIRVEHWTQERINQTHRTYLKRIMRKNAYLYQKLEETLYRYYDVRKVLEQYETEYKATYQAQMFAELYAYDVVSSDEDGYEWTIRINTRGGNQEIMTFGRRTTAKMSSLDKTLHKDGLKLLLVYKRFAEMASNQEIQIGELEELKNDMINTMSDEKLDKLVDSRVAILAKELEKYKDLYGKAKDPIDEIMTACKLDDDMVGDAEQVEKFYKAVEEAINTF